MSHASNDPNVAPLHGVMGTRQVTDGLSLRVRVRGQMCNFVSKQRVPCCVATSHSSCDKRAGTGVDLVRKPRKEGGKAPLSRAPVGSVASPHRVCGPAQLEGSPLLSSPSNIPRVGIGLVFLPGS